MSTVALSDFEIAKQEAFWGTFGKGGVEHCAGRCPLHKLQWKKLTDCDTEHLQAILRTQRQIRYHMYTKLIESILKDRGVKPEKFSFEAEQEFFEKIRLAEKTYRGSNETRQEGD